MQHVRAFFTFLLCSVLLFAADVDARLVKLEIQKREVVADGMAFGEAGAYEKLRAGNGGVGAAALQGARCMGCRLELTPTELGRIRNASPDEVQRCEECRRILVRPGD